MDKIAMKQYIYAIILLIGTSVSANATVLFPHFVDIAPNYEEGLSKELQEAGVPCGINRKDDAIETKPLRSTIYILGRPDDSYVAAYCEQEEEHHN